MSLDIKKNDTVTLISGDEKGKSGRVIAVYPKESRVVVERLNIIKKHMKPNKQYQQGGIIEREAPVHRSNVMLLCPKCNKPTRIESRILGDGGKVRVCKKCREVIDK